MKNTLNTLVGKLKDSVEKPATIKEVYVFFAIFLGLLCWAGHSRSAKQAKNNPSLTPVPVKKEQTPEYPALKSDTVQESDVKEKTSLQRHNTNENGGVSLVVPYHKGKIKASYSLVMQNC